MAWSCTGTVADASGLAALAVSVTGNDDQAASLDQVQQAKRAARILIDRGQIGAGPYTVVLSGTANPGHVRPDRPNPPKDSVTITVEANSRATVG